MISEDWELSSIESPEILLKQKIKTVRWKKNNETFTDQCEEEMTEIDFQ